MRALGTCWVKGEGAGRCAGQVSRWVFLVGGNWRTPIEVWTCNKHEALPFSVLCDIAQPIAEVKTSTPLEVTPLRKRA